jgi:hypothetical protein
MKYFLKNIESRFFHQTLLKKHNMDMGVIKSLLIFYKNAVSQRKIHAFEKNIAFKISILDCMNISQVSWENVSSITILNFFKKIISIDIVMMMKKKNMMVILMILSKLTSFKQ